jgi:hypothetical protein
MRAECKDPCAKFAEKEARIRELELFCNWLIGYTDGRSDAYTALIREKAIGMVSR